MRDTIVKLRERMADNIDAVVIPSSDSHYSEYVSSHFKTREYISGFTGSAGTVVVWKDNAGLWTDGRYYTQANIELRDSGIDLFKAGELDVKPYDEYLLEILSEGSTVALNGELFTARQLINMKKKFEQKNIRLDTENDFANEIWQNRPEIRESEVFALKDQYQGSTVTEKLTALRELLTKNNQEGFIVSNLDSVAWLFNIRANDIDFFPVVHAYGFVSTNEAYLFVDQSRMTERAINLLEKADVVIKPYTELKKFLRGYNTSLKVGCHLNSLNFNLYQTLMNNSHFTVEDSIEYVDELKSIKNKAEIENMKDAYLNDCVTLANFWADLHAEIEAGKTLNEYQLVQDLKQYRLRNDLCLGESFGAIIAYNENAAMMHYAPSKSASSDIKNNGTLLVDSGGQYQNGTTDITRTFALGEVSKQVVDDFTLALKGIISLQNAVFIKGSTASDLDILCRQFLWKKGIDYKCGTGHGVGYVSTVHEGSVNFRYNTKQKHILPGMVLTVEPGVYREGVHGIRTENTVVVKEEITTEFGQYFSLENICFFPIDVNLINKTLLTSFEIDYINNYHKTVYEKLSVRVTETTHKWLKEKCKPL